MRSYDVLPACDLTHLLGQRGATAVAQECTSRPITVDGTKTWRLACRLLAYLKDAVAPLGAGLGIYFSSHINLTNTRQRAHSVDATKPLWHRSDSDTWYNAALCEPLCRTILSCRAAMLASATTHTKRNSGRSAYTHSLLAVPGRAHFGVPAC